MAFAGLCRAPRRRASLPPTGRPIAEQGFRELPSPEGPQKVSVAHREGRTRSLQIPPNDKSLTLYPIELGGLLRSKPATGPCRGRSAAAGSEPGSLDPWRSLGRTKGDIPGPSNRQ